MPYANKKGDKRLAPIADRIAKAEYAELRTATWEQARDTCDLYTQGEYGVLRLDMLTDMVTARVSKRRAGEVRVG